ncbi:3 beta-hydroxysteroid dehydrogenase/Delta 5--_4-isomerase [BD1-7 clade bacterium]|uniref:3 beta-hydroxysteroid dehydrogenase/Delta 5-->4-isomerase n=1 Tax=BD1-7 clade bacterium TaxID=2029982 RepID=A0A5S9PKR6_9GAMM|nr:3 beta-hydroxysteroid dehydrogenase/Delta 5-->4-isomerase [BD1-7 clade bacterium]CAA0104578.1 3 beta-hydroxysteroid dehydrogenase/Delta 5-->4-isomerase [BD1-7 clade bacterium]
MNVLVVGGSGLIGGEIALHLKANGHDVTIMSRTSPVAPALASLSFIQADYINDTIDPARLEGFDWLVFSAAADIRNVPMDGSESPDSFYARANDKAVPEFIAAAKAAGVKKVVYIGTFYPQVAPQQIGVCPYVTSRHNTCESVLALADEHFSVFALNAPFVLGFIEGLPVPHLSAIVDYASGKIPDMPDFAPVGGTNHITSKSVAEAALNAFNQGTSGTAYLIGDVNLTWQEYLELWFSAAGNPKTLPVLDQEHPMFPYVIQFAGPGTTVSFELDTQTQTELDYSRNQISAMIETVVAAHR